MNDGDALNPSLGSVLPGFASAGAIRCGPCSVIENGYAFRVGAVPLRGFSCAAFCFQKATTW